MIKKYQIFISSTYEDLKDERRFVCDAILSLHQFPIGMEQFSASDESQWEVIKKLIDTSDYYVLILGKRYGSLSENGKSYTECEIDYAKKQGVPILAFIKADDAGYSSLQIDNELEKSSKLNAFINKVKSGRIVKWFKNPYELSYLVATALHNEMEKNNRPGWLRAIAPQNAAPGYDLSNDNDQENEYDDFEFMKPVDTYEFTTYQHPSDGEHREVNKKEEVIAEGLYKNNELVKGIEFNNLIRITNGRLIFKPNCPEDPYDSTDDFKYDKMESYGWGEFYPFKWSEPYIEHEGLEKFYVVDFIVDGETKQMFNIRTLEEFLEKVNPKRLEQLKKLIQYGKKL